MGRTRDAVTGVERVDRLMLFFAVVYTVEGLCQAKAGIVWQPLTHYLKQVVGWSPVQIAASLAVLDVPWVIKPLYGIVSDFLPLFGYRRRSYLLLANLCAAVAFLYVTQVLETGTLVGALLLTAIAMALSSTVCGALLVENGQRTRSSAAFINQQWLWFNVATMVAALLGGQLIEQFSAAGALHIAALLAAIAPIAVIICTIAWIDEPRASIDLPAIRASLRALLQSFRSRTLWLIAGFLFCYYFSPGFGTPLYFFMSDQLQFSQGFIGWLSAVGAAGWIAGGLLYHYLLRQMETPALLRLSILAGTLACLAYLGMVDAPAAIAIYFINGIAGMIANIATLTLAAENCPRHAEGFAFAALMSVINLASPLADTIGAFLYERLFHHELAPLIIVSAVFTAAIFALVPLLDSAAVPVRLKK